MKKFWLIATLFSAFFFIAETAEAFSVDQSANQNTDGTQKFTDPDEQMPGFVGTLDRGNANNGALSFGSAPVTPPSQGQYDSGAQTFDQAFAHQQDK